MNRRLAPPAQRAERTDWFRFEASADGASAIVSIYDEIGYFGLTASDFAAQLMAVNASSIELHLNSIGGEIFDGIAIGNSLIQHPATVNVIVDGIAASIASVIAMAGDTVVMAPGSQMMIHDGSGLCMGNSADMQDMAALLDRQSDNIASIYAARAGGTPASWRTAMQAETWYTAEEAVAAGLADKVLPGRPKPEKAQLPDLSMFAYAGRGAAPAPLINSEIEAGVAIAVHHTATVDTAWDGPEAVAAMPNEYADLHYCHAWQSASANASSHTPGDDDVDDEKQQFKFPHHLKKGGPANIPACHNGLARLDGAAISDEAKTGVKAHLQAHIDDAEKDSKSTDRLDGTTLADAFRAGMARAAGEMPGWDPEVFRSAVQASATDAAPVSAPVAAAPAVQPGWAAPVPVAEPQPSLADIFRDSVAAMADDAPAPTAPQRTEPAPEPIPAPAATVEPEPTANPLADIFKAAVSMVANSAPSPTAPPPAAGPEPDPFDPTVVTRALRDEVRR